MATHPRNRIRHPASAHSRPHAPCSERSGREACVSASCGDPWPWPILFPGFPAWNSSPLAARWANGSGRSTGPLRRWVRPLRGRLRTPAGRQPETKTLSWSLTGTVSSKRRTSPLPRALFQMRASQAASGTSAPPWMKSRKKLLGSVEWLCFATLARSRHRARLRKQHATSPQTMPPPRSFGSLNRMALARSCRVGGTSTPDRSKDQR